MNKHIFIWNFHIKCTKIISRKWWPVSYVEKFFWKCLSSKWICNLQTHLHNTNRRPFYFHWKLSPRFASNHLTIIWSNILQSIDRNHSLFVVTCNNQVDEQSWIYYWNLYHVFISLSNSWKQKLLPINFQVHG